MNQWRLEMPSELTLPAWQAMRHALWPEMEEQENALETQAMLAEKDRFFVRIAQNGIAQHGIAQNMEGQFAGFAEATLRHDYVNGCATTPVAFLEGIYVERWARRQGIARLLVSAVEGWARDQGCHELASDALLDNSDSHSMHRGLGFEETERVVYFRKELAS